MMEMDFELVLLKEEDKLYLVQERSDLNFLEQSDFCFFHTHYCWLCTSHLLISSLV